MAEKKSTAVAIISIIVIVAAVYVIYAFGFKKEIGHTPGTTRLICSECRYGFDIDTNSMNDRLKDSPNKNRGMVKCEDEDCGEYAAMIAQKCPNPECGKHYLLIDCVGGKYRCPHCNKRPDEIDP